MGVPGLFRDLIRTVPLVDIGTCSYAHFLFDYNSLMYHALREPSTDAVDETQRIVQYTSKWIRTIAPTRSVYVSIDGPVPYAKMVCQRRRRFKRILEETYRDRQHARFRQPRKDRFDTTQFTPGTRYLDRFVRVLSPYIKLAAPEARVFLSDHHVPGEGEHKLMRYLKRLPPHEPVCIYGLDADLIVLSLLSGHPNLYLIRDTEDGVDTLSIEACRTAILKHVTQSIRDPERPYAIDPECIMRDLCCVWFLGGNDFVPGLFAYSIRTKGVSVLNETYVDVFRKRSEIEGKPVYLTDPETHEIRWNMMLEILRVLGSREKTHVIQTLRKLSRDQPVSGRPKTIEEAMERFSHMSYWNPRHPFHEMAMEDVAPVARVDKWLDWCEAYRSRYDLDIESAKREFLRAIDWTWRYYHSNTPPTWDFAYEYEAAPLASWFSDPTPEQGPWEGRTHPYSPLTQLAYVIPSTCYRLLPYAIRMPRQSVPIRLDYLGGKYIYAEPRMDMGSIDAIEAIVSQAPLTDIDRKLDRIYWRAREIR